MSSTERKARKFPYLPEVFILAGIGGVKGAVFSIYTFLLPDIGLLGATYLALGWIYTIFGLLVSLVWIAVGLLWRLGEKS